MRALYHTTECNLLVITRHVLGGKRLSLALVAPKYDAARLCVLLQLFSCNKAKVAPRTLVLLAGGPVRIELRDGRVALTTLVAVPWLRCGPTLGSGIVLRRRLLSIVMGRGLLSIVMGRGIVESLLYVSSCMASTRCARRCTLRPLSMT